MMLRIDNFKVCLLILVLLITGYAKADILPEAENILPQLNHAFVRFLVLEQAIEVVNLVYESKTGLGWATKEKLCNDFSMSYEDMEKEHERLKILFGNSPLYRVWRLNSDRLFQEGLTLDAGI